MASMAERYDRLAERYERWWAPVLAPTARGLATNTELSALIADRPAARILDVGTGTGTLAIALVRQHPHVTVTAEDGSVGMLDEARRQARNQLPERDWPRLEFDRGDAASLPFDDGTFDAVASSFVYQLVPDRFAALREARRVLRPDGLLAIVTWLGHDELFDPDEALEDAIDDLELDFDEGDDDHASGNFASADAAAAQVRRAGFRDVRAQRHDLVHHYDPATYLEFLEEYAERSLFEGLKRRDRDRLWDETRRRLERLKREAFVWRVPVVTVTGRRSARS